MDIFMSEIEEIIINYGGEITRDFKTASFVRELYEIMSYPITKIK